MKERKKQADYASRPLTAEERIFAEEHHNVIFSFMNSYKLDAEEWYDILIIDYLNAVKKYCSRPELHEYSFSTIAYKKLSLAVHHYWRSYNSQSNFPEGGFVSLDYTMQGDNPFAENTVDAWYEDKKQNTEKVVISKITLLNIMNELSELQQKIFSMLIDEYTNADIKRTLEIKDKAFKSELEIIKEIAFRNMH